MSFLGRSFWHARVLRRAISLARSLLVQARTPVCHVANFVLESPASSFITMTYQLDAATERNSYPVKRPWYSTDKPSSTALTTHDATLGLLVLSPFSTHVAAHPGFSTLLGASALHPRVDAFAHLALLPASLDTMKIHWRVPAVKPLVDSSPGAGSFYLSVTISSSASRPPLLFSGSWSTGWTDLNGTTLETSFLQLYFKPVL